MKIEPTVWKIQALKCFIDTVMGTTILIWQSHDQFLKIAIHRVLVFVKHNSGVLRLIVTQMIHLISILVDLYTGLNIICIIQL